MVAAASGVAGLVLATDELDRATAAAWSDPGVTADTLAFLQYTSGSTGEPKGVEVPHRAVVNFLTNAMKFTPRNGTIDVTCVQDVEEIAFTVTDSGVGIPLGEVEKVFSSFYQVDGSTTREHGGTGLGLTISRRLTELMGGTLDLESEGHDRGTTARFRLPAYHDKQSAEPLA